MKTRAETRCPRWLVGKTGGHACPHQDLRIGPVARDIHVLRIHVIATLVETALGTQAAVVQSTSTLPSRLQNLQLSAKETISNLGGADAADLVVNLQSYQKLLQRSLEAFSKISSTTLPTCLT